MVRLSSFMKKGKKLSFLLLKIWETSLTYYLVRYTIVSYKNRLSVACDWHLKLAKLRPLRNVQVELTTTKLVRTVILLHFSLIAQHVNLGWHWVEIPKIFKVYETWFDVYLVHVKSSGRLFQIFVAFSECPNFNGL